MKNSQSLFRIGHHYKRNHIGIWLWWELRVRSTVIDEVISNAHMGSVRIVNKLIFAPSFLFLMIIFFLGGDVSAQENEGNPESERIRFAVLGDFGTNNEDERDVADMINSWDVDFIISTGDNYYRAALGKGGNGLNQLDNSVGKYYCPFQFETGVPDSGVVNCPPEQQSSEGNRFFPTIGNHDRTDMSNGITDYLNYFTLPGSGFDNSSGNERYYDFVQGPVHFFAIDSDTARRDDADMAAQKTWLEDGLARSTTPWQVVYFHQSAYSSSDHGSDPLLQWPFAEWGADMVFQGHDHVYERILVDGIVYFVTGNGGRYLYEFDTVIGGSMVRHNGGFGAMLVTATDTAVSFEAWSVPESQRERGNSSPSLIDYYYLPSIQEGCTVANVVVGEAIDDAVQDKDSGETDISTLDLVMVNDGSADQYIGLRFLNVDLIKERTIHEAVIQFTARENEASVTNLTFYGQDTAHADAFKPQDNDIWGRPRTSVSVTWDDITPWIRSSPRANYLSPDLSPIVREIIARDDWESGNAMAFLIEGSGRRTAYAYDHGRENPPLLSILHCDPVDIGDHVWIDLNDDGIHQQTEPLAGSVPVNLWSAGVDGEIGGDDDMKMTSYISGNQGYAFRDVQPGTYYIEFELPEGFAYSEADRGEDDEIDSDADPATGFSPVFVYDGISVSDIDAGLTPEAAIVFSASGFLDYFSASNLLLLAGLLAIIIIVVAVHLIARRRRAG